MNDQPGANEDVILIADDDTTTRIMMREVLEQLKFSVIEAENGILAMEYYKQYHPDALILDIDMPERDGLSVCAEIRGAKRGEFIPILISTGMDDIESIDSAYRAGATDFIAKPINWPILGRRMRYIIRASKAIAGYKKAEKRAFLLGRVVENSSNEIFVFNGDSFLLKEVNTSARENLGYSKQEVCGLLFTDLFTDVSRSQFSAQLNPLFTDQSAGIAQTVTMRRKNGSSYPVEMRIHIFEDEDKKSQLVAIAQSISDREAAEERMRYLAFYDVLTGLPNRQLFTEELEFMIRLARRTENLVAVLFIDLDNFKRINDTLGHSSGDKLLRIVAERLTESVRESDYIARQVDPKCTITVCRLGGDEFTVVLNNLQDEHCAGVVATRIIAKLNKKITLDGHEMVVTPSIGIAIAPSDCNDVDSLLKHADTAMYHAKSIGKNNFQFFSESMNLRGRERLTMENDFRKAIERDEFLVYYQPQIDIETRTIVGAEALVRWKHPTRNIIPPNDFIPLAEEMGLIVDLGALVFRKACKQFALWSSCGLIEGKISVNVSSLQFDQPNLVDLIVEILAETGLAPQNLEIEITESIMMSHVEKALPTLFRLKEMGISISIDDFGTGYSSLSYLKRLPLDTIKIDRSFVSDVSVDKDSKEIVSAIIAMASSLNLNIIAEGVETEEQLKFLRDKGVPVAQGYLFSKPLPAEKLEIICKSGNQFNSKHKEVFS